MVKLVDDDVVERIRSKPLQVCTACQCLHRRKQHICLHSTFKASVFAKAIFGTHAAKSIQGLAQDFLPMSHEQHPLESQRIKSCQPCLTQSCGQHHQTFALAGAARPLQGLQGLNLYFVGLD